MFEFDRRSPRSSRAIAALPWAILAAAVLMMPLDALFTRLVGGFWGLLLAIVTVVAPVGTLYRVAVDAVPTRRAVVEGVGLALLSAAVCAWIFGGPLGFAP